MTEPKTDPAIRAPRPSGDALGQIAAHLGGPASAAMLLYYLLTQQIDGVEARLTDLSTRVDVTSTRVVELGADVRDLGRRIDRLEAAPPQPAVTPARR